MWRETDELERVTEEEQFQSTPSVWRETAATIFPSTSARTFQSTPSVWRETVKEISTIYQKVISIHSLRVEGDDDLRKQGYKILISIHSLRVEGDCY